VRVYLPATVPLLRRWLQSGVADATVGTAVTPALRESYREGDTEELEWVAQLAAARASLRLLAAEPGTPLRRVVVAAEVPDGDIATAVGADDAAVVSLGGAVPKQAWASVLVDDPAAMHAATADGAVLAAAVEVVRRGGGGPGDDDGRDRLDDADAVELGWWAVQELTALLGD
jgi:hypothetical protein